MPPERGKGGERMAHKPLDSVLESEAVPAETISIPSLRRERRALRPWARAVDIGLAYSEHRLHEAYALVHRQYLRHGYEQAGAGDVRFVPQCGLASTRTFTASIDNRVVATASLVLDSALGLPMDSAYAGELDALRAPHIRLAEVSCLATRRRGDVPVLMRVFRALYAYARYRADVTDLCITVNPSQRAFYQRVLLFDALGPVREYKSCNGAPGVGLRLDLTTAEQRYCNAHGFGMIGRFFLGRVDYPLLAAQLQEPDEVSVRQRYQFARACVEWQHLSNDMRAQIIASYGGLLRRRQERAPQPI